MYVDGPQTPNLTVDYHNYPFGVILGRNLTATCFACVGDVGNISWTIMDWEFQPLQRNILDDLIQEIDTVRGKLQKISTGKYNYPEVLVEMVSNTLEIAVELVVL